MTSIDISSVIRRLNHTCRLNSIFKLPYVSLQSVSISNGKEIHKLKKNPDIKKDMKGIIDIGNYKDKKSLWKIYLLYSKTLFISFALARVISKLLESGIIVTHGIYNVKSASIVKIEWKDAKENNIVFYTDDYEGPRRDKELYSACIILDNGKRIFATSDPLVMGIKEPTGEDELFTLTEEECKIGIEFDSESMDHLLEGMKKILVDLDMIDKRGYELIQQIRCDIERKCKEKLFGEALLLPYNPTVGGIDIIIKFIKENMNVRYDDVYWNEVAGVLSMEKGDTLVMFTEKTKEVIAVMVAQYINKENTGFSKGPILMIHALVVHKNHRGMRISQYLLDHAKDKLINERRRCEAIIMKSSLVDFNAAKYFTRFGFSAVRVGDQGFCMYYKKDM